MRVDPISTGFWPLFHQNQCGLTPAGELHSLHFHCCVPNGVIALTLRRSSATEFREVNHGEQDGGGGQCSLLLGTFDCRIVKRLAADRGRRFRPDLKRRSPPRPARAAQRLFWRLVYFVREPRAEKPEDTLQFAGAT